MKTFADICLERAEKATEGPWKWQWNQNKAVIWNKDKTIVDAEAYRAVNCEHYYENPGGIEEEADAEFIAHARTDVPELARRLNKALSELRDIEQGGYVLNYKMLRELIDELEAMPNGDNK